MTIGQLNELPPDAFVATIGPIFESSPWIAQAVALDRPFADREELFAALQAVLDGSPDEARVALIAAHPDLAGRLAREGRLTPLSSGEQAAAGLETLTDDERASFDMLNTAYRAQFGFPFVICVREQNKNSILAAMEQRLRNDRAMEIATALREIEKIAWLRLCDVVHD